MRDESQLTFKFPFGQSYTHYALPYSKLDSAAPTCPAIYSWHIRIPSNAPTSLSPFITDLFAQTNLTAEIRGNLRLKYTGTLRKETVAESLHSNPYFIDFLMAASYPLYIGISRLLRNRLRAHKQALERSKENRPWSRQMPYETIEPDSEEESAQFGERLGSIFAQNNFHSTDVLYVKYCPVPQYADIEHVMQKLGEAEYFANTLFNPVFGRR